MGFSTPQDHIAKTHWKHSQILPAPGLVILPNLWPQLLPGGCPHTALLLWALHDLLLCKISPQQQCPAINNQARSTATLLEAGQAGQRSSQSQREGSPSLHCNSSPLEVVDASLLKVFMVRLVGATWSSWRCPSSLQGSWIGLYDL